MPISYTTSFEIPRNTADAFIIKAGNGGDYEWLYDVYAWITWIKRELNITTSDFHIYCNNDCKADEAWLLFNNPVHKTLFLLKAPEYV